MREARFFLLGVLLVLIVAALAGCKEVQPKPAKPAEVIKVYVPTYVPIPKWLTKRCQWPKGKSLLEVVEVAKARRICNEKYEGQFDAIDSMQGTPAQTTQKVQ